MLALYGQELDISRQQTYELEQRLQHMSQQQNSMVRTDQDLKIKFEELTTALRQQDAIMRSKDEEISKLREDNQNMFKDLKEFAENEETIKLELQEHKGRRHEVESIAEDLRDKTHNQENKVRTLQVELEKLRREASIKVESQRFVDQDLDTLRNENEALRDRLIQLETDRANMINEKERKDRDSKHL